MKYLVFLLLIMFSLGIQAQDPHFSQLPTSPLNLNPSLTGFTKDKHRLSFKYKEQWNGILKSNDYKTAFFSYDSQKCLGQTGEYFGYGMSLLGDEAGTHNLRTFSGNLSLAYRRPINRNNFIAGGVQVGVLQSYFGNKDFRFDTQFGSSGFNPSANNFENFERFSTDPMLDISLGTDYYNSNHDFQIGIAAFHINRPSISFLGVTRDNDPRVETRWVIHSDFKIKNIRKNQFRFRFPFMLQKFNPNILYWQLLPSLVWNRKIGLRNTNNTASISIGSRITKDAPKQTIIVDSAILSAEVTMNFFAVGITYEINLSTSARASNFRTGPELSLLFFIDKKNTCVVCPTMANPVSSKSKYYNNYNY